MKSIEMLLHSLSGMGRGSNKLAGVSSLDLSLLTYETSLDVHLDIVLQLGPIIRIAHKGKSVADTRMSCPFVVVTFLQDFSPKVVI